MFGLGQAGHEDDGDGRGGGLGLQAPGHLKAVDAGHDGVQQHHVGQGLGGAADGGLAIERDQHGVAGFVQRVVQRGQVVGHVVDDQHHQLIRQKAGARQESSW